MIFVIHFIIKYLCDWNISIANVSGLWLIKTAQAVEMGNANMMLNKFVKYILSFQKSEMLNFHQFVFGLFDILTRQKSLPLSRRRCLSTHTHFLTINTYNPGGSYPQF